MDTLLSVTSLFKSDLLLLHPSRFLWNHIRKPIWISQRKAQIGLRPSLGTRTCFGDQSLEILASTMRFLLTDSMAALQRLRRIHQDIVGVRQPSSMASTISPTRRIRQWRRHSCTVQCLGDSSILEELLSCLLGLQHEGRRELTASKGHVYLVNKD